MYLSASWNAAFTRAATASMTEDRQADTGVNVKFTIGLYCVFSISQCTVGVGSSLPGSSLPAFTDLFHSFRTKYQTKAYRKVTIMQSVKNFTTVFFLKQKMEKKKVS